MFKEPFDIVPLEAHLDERGNLFEILRFKDQAVPGEGQLYYFTINSGKRRGDHYHKNKLEWFVCVSGEATVLLEDKDHNKKKIVLNSEKPTIIYCSPFTAHALYNEKDEPAVMISYGSKQHDPEDPDTFSQFIEYEGI